VKTRKLIAPVARPFVGVDLLDDRVGIIAAPDEGATNVVARANGELGSETTQGPYEGCGPRRTKTGYRRRRSIARSAVSVAEDMGLGVLGGRLLL
jgi:hypothetical protein